MARASLKCVLHYTRTLLGPGADQTEQELLERFLARREEAAFAALLERHGPMVLAVCRRILADAHAAEDAFQTTFLTLAHKATSLRKRPSLASWLHGVACRVSWRARDAAARRRACERRLWALRLAAPAVDTAPSDLRLVLDEELARLPEKYRAPLVLCYLQGQTNEQAADQLGWPTGTVKGRLSRARDLLRARLARRGLGLPAILPGMAVVGGASAAMPAALARLTLHRVLAPAGRGVAGREDHPSATCRAEGALGPTTWVRIRTALATLLVAGALAGGAGALVQGKADPPAAPKRPGGAAQGQPAAGPGVAPAAAPHLDNHGDPLPPGARARLGTARFRHGGWIYGLAYSPDGKLLAAGGTEGAISLWDAASGRLVGRLVGHRRGYCQHVVFSPDGRLLASLGWEEAEIVLWDVAARKELQRLPGHKSQTFAVAFSPDSKLVASGGLSGGALLWDITTGQIVRRLEDAGEVVGAVAFSPDGKTVTAGGRNGTLHLWDVASGKVRHRLTPPGGGRIAAATFSRDGQLLALGSINHIDSSASVWDPDTGKLRRHWSGHKGYVYSLSFSPDGSILAAHASRSYDLRSSPSVRLWNVNTGREAVPLQEAWGSVHGVAFAPDGKVVAAAVGNSIRRWDAATGKELPPRDGHLGTVWTLAIAANGKTVYSGAQDATVRAWDTTSGKELFNLVGHDSLVIGVRLSADGKVLGSACGYGHVCLWDAATGRALRKEVVPARSMRAFALTPDGRTVVTASDSQGLIFWEAATWKEQRRFAKDVMFYAVTFSPDGRTIGAGAYTGSSGYQHTAMWDAATGRALGRDSGVSHITSVAFSPDGGLLVSAQDDYDKLVRLHEVPSGKVVREMRGHTNGVRDVAFSPDGRTVASASRDHTVRLWEVASGQERRRLEGHHGEVFALAFAADGRTLVSGGADTTILVWDLAAPVHASRKGKAPTAEDLERLWADLASASAPRAYEAMCRLTAFPDQAVPLLRARLWGPQAKGGRVAELIRLLDDPRFAVRERAMEELRKLGRQVEADLREALTNPPSAEVRARVTRLLEGISGPGNLERNANELQARRAIEVLEGVGSPQARQALETLARGASEAWVAREARTSLQRLERRPQGGR